MIIRQIPVGMLHTNCYIVGDETEKVCAVIDPGASVNKIESAISEMGMTVSVILLTHGHFDHVMAAATLQAKTGAKLLIHREDEPWLKPENVGHRGYIAEEYEAPRVDGYLEDGLDIQVGKLNFRVMHTPGHSRGSCSFICGDALFSGDTLFCGACGRWDLEGGDEREMMDSLRLLSQIPDDLRVYPGHEQLTTLNTERQANLYMRAAMEQ